MALTPELDALAELLAQRLGASWEGAMLRVIHAWRKLHRGGQLTQQSARAAMFSALYDWPALAMVTGDPLLDRIFSAGFMHGVSISGVVTGPDMGDDLVLEWLKQNPHGFMPALRGLAEDGIKALETVLTEAYAGHNDLGEARPFDLDAMVDQATLRADVGVNRARLIVRTETAKASAYGRILAWGNDPQRDYYDYLWIATHDDRTKDISLLFEKRNPYSYWGIRHVWEHDHNVPQLVRNRHTGKMAWETSAFNCRCTPVRVPKSPEKLRNEGLITQAQYEAEAAL